MTAWLSRRCFLVVALACASAVGGCASVYDREHSFGDGWRIGRVEAIGANLEVPTWPSNDCRSVTVAATPPPAFASVWFTQMRHHQRRIVLLPRESRVAVGDRVFFNLRDCAVPAASAPKAAL